MPGRKRPSLKHRVVAYGALAGLLYGAYLFQPVRLDLFPRQPPPFAPVDPDSKALFRKGTRVAVVVAHPDDSEFYLAPLLLKLSRAGAEVAQVVLSDGDKGYYFWQDTSAVARTRRQEQLEASKRWGAREVRFLGRPDGRLERDGPLTQLLRAELQRLRPEYVLAFDPDYPPRASHGDHRAAGRAVVLAARKTPSVRWLLLFSTMGPNRVEDVTREWDEGSALIALHKSQFTGDRLLRVKATIASDATEAGQGVGAAFAVPLRCVRLR